MTGTVHDRLVAAVEPLARTSSATTPCSASSIDQALAAAPEVKPGDNTSAMSLRRNSAWNIAGIGLPLIVGLGTIPYLIKSIGIEAFGILTLIWVLIGYFSMFDLGLGRALTQQVAGALASGQHSRLPTIAKTGVAFTAVAGVFGALVLAVAADSVATRWLGVSKGIQEDVVRCLLVAALGIPLATITSGLRGILEAYGDFGAANAYRIVLGAANYCLPVLTVIFVGKSLFAIVGGLVFVRAAVTGAHLYRVNKHLPQRWRRTPSSRGELSKLLSFGSWMTLTNIVSPVLMNADRFFIASILGAAVVSYYTIPFEVLFRMLIVPSAISAAMFPMLAAAMAKSDADAARSLYRKCLLIVSLLMTGICVLAAALSKLALSIWISPEFSEQSWIIASVLSVGILANSIAFVPFAAIQASGDARSTAMLHLCELLLYVPILLGCLHLFGLIGAAVAWTLRVALDMTLLMYIAHSKKL